MNQIILWGIFMQSNSKCKHIQGEILKEQEKDYLEEDILKDQKKKVFLMNLVTQDVQLQLNNTVLLHKYQDPNDFVDFQLKNEAVFLIQLGGSPNDRRSTKKREEHKKEISKNAKIEELQKENEMLLEQIEELKEKVKNREEIAQVLTTGYVKDMTHMKEMLFR